MPTGIRPSYCPAIRMKAGELAGLRDLEPDVADHIFPRIIVPPGGERDDTFQLDLFKTDGAPNIANPLSASWLGRSVLVDATHLIPDVNRQPLGLWLPQMFERSRRAGVPAIPLVALKDLTANTRRAYRESCGFDATRLGIVIPSDELVGRGILEPLLDHLGAMSLCPATCTVIADFAASEFPSPDIVAPIIGGALEILQEAGPWQQIVFQGTSYPCRNPAEPDGLSVVPRNEWLAWRQAVGFDPDTAAHMLFGDYAADCATMSFGENGGRAIRHYRYTTPNAWMVQRGSTVGSDRSVMRDVCRRIVDNIAFAGPSFSSADDFIFKTSIGEAGPGNSTTWRAVNTTHHITQVVSDIGRVRGFSLRPHAVNRMQQQPILL